MKPQGVRIFDVLVLGPFFMWYALTDRKPKWAREALLLAGLGTIAYNARNYLKVRDAELKQVTQQ